MSLTTNSITKFNVTKYAQLAIKMALLLEQEPVCGIITGYNDKPEEPAANATATENPAFKDCMNRHGVVRWTIRLAREPRSQAEYTVFEDANTLWKHLASAYKSKLRLNILQIREDLWGIKIQECGDVDNYVLPIDRKSKNYNLDAGSLTTDTNANRDTGKTISQMSEKKHIFYLLHGMPRNDKWKVFLELKTEKTPWWLRHPMRLSPSLSKRKLRSRERMGSVQKLCSSQSKMAKVAEVAKSAKLQRWIREMITEILKMIGKGRIWRSAFIASSEVISPRTAWASNAAILQ